VGIQFGTRRLQGSTPTGDKESAVCIPAYNGDVSSYNPLIVNGRIAAG
jgi:hypothetical protein